MGRLSSKKQVQVHNSDNNWVSNFMVGNLGQYEIIFEAFFMLYRKQQALSMPCCTWTRLFNSIYMQLIAETELFIIIILFFFVLYIKELIYEVMVKNMQNRLEQGTKTQEKYKIRRLENKFFLIWRDHLHIQNFVFLNENWALNSVKLKLNYFLLQNNQIKGHL
jgi:hypothetical protein